MQTEILNAAREINIALENFRRAAQNMSALCDVLSWAFDTESQEFETLANDSERFGAIVAELEMTDYSGIAAQCKTAH